MTLILTEFEVTVLNGAAEPVRFLLNARNPVQAVSFAFEHYCDKGLFNREEEITFHIRKVRTEIEDRRRPFVPLLKGGAA